MFTLGKFLLFCICLHAAHFSENESRCTITGEKCHFPFLYDGRNHSKCLSYIFRTWCATTYYGYSFGEWHYCAKACPGTLPATLETTQPTMSLPIEVKSMDASFLGEPTITEAQESSGDKVEPTSVIKEMRLKVLQAQESSGDKVEPASVIKEMRLKALQAQESSGDKVEPTSVIEEMRLKALQAQVSGKSQAKRTPILSTDSPELKHKIEIGTSAAVPHFEQLTGFIEKEDPLEDALIRSTSSTEVDTASIVAPLKIVVKKNGGTDKTLSLSKILQQSNGGIENTSTTPILLTSSTDRIRVQQRSFLESLPTQQHETISKVYNSPSDALGRLWTSQTSSDLKTSANNKTSSTPVLIVIWIVMTLFIVGMATLVCRIRRRSISGEKNLENSLDAGRAIELQEGKFHQVADKDLASGDTH